MGECDAYVNLAGGMKLENRQLTLELWQQLFQVIKTVLIDEKTLIFGEVGLSGEVRGVSQAQQRVKEAEKMGFTTCIMPKANLEGLQGKFKIQLIGMANLREVMQYI